MFPRTFNLPLCDMPIFTSLTPRWPPLLIICSKAGIKDSPPSRPNLFVPTNLMCKNFSKPSASTNLFNIAFSHSQ